MTTEVCKQQQSISKLTTNKEIIFSSVICVAHERNLERKEEQKAMVALIEGRMEKDTWEKSSRVQSPIRKLLVASLLQLIHPIQPK